MANESQSLFKIVVFLGLVLFMASIMATPWVYVGQPIPPNSTWGQMQAQMESFPIFNNPFAGAQTTFGVWLPVAGNTTYFGGTTSVGSYTTFGTENDCATGTPWNCINDPNGPDNSTTIKLTPDGVTHNLHFSVNVTGPSGAYMTSAMLELRCNTPTGRPTSGYFQLLASPDLLFQSTLQGTVPLCASPSASSEFPMTLTPTNVTWSTCMVGGAVKMSCLPGGPNHGTFSISFGPLYSSNYNPINITYIAVHMTFSSAISASCTGDFFSNLACQVGSFFTLIWTGFLFLVNGIIFVFQVIFWFVGMVGTFFTSILSLVGVEGAPPIITGFVGILLLGLVFYVSFVVMGKVRGTGNTG